MKKFLMFCVFMLSPLVANAQAFVLHECELKYSEITQDQYLTVQVTIQCENEDELTLGIYGMSDCATERTIIKAVPVDIHKYSNGVILGTAFVVIPRQQIAEEVPILVTHWEPAQFGITIETELWTNAAKVATDEVWVDYQGPFPDDMPIDPIFVE